MSLRAHIADVVDPSRIVRAALIIIIAAPAYAPTSGAVATMPRGSVGATVS